MKHSSLTPIEPLPEPAWRRAHWQAVAFRLHEWEMAAVRQQVRIGRSTLLRPLAFTLNHLGNGWLYPLLAGALLLGYPHVFLAILLPAGIAAGSSHLIYPWIKRRVARHRPCDRDPNLPRLLRPLDRYSFPSGHCMTVAAIVIPVAAVLPQLAVPSALTCGLVGWARIVAGHHYPSDIVAGIALGAAISLPVTLALI